MKDKRYPKNFEWKFRYNKFLIKILIKNII